MTQSDIIFLKCLRKGWKQHALVKDPGLSADEWLALLQRAEEQDVLPIIYECVYRNVSFRRLDLEVRKAYQKKAVQIATRQIIQTNEFLTLVLHAQAQGLDPVVMKGIIIRSMYPLAMLRPSVDEDLLVSANQWRAFDEFFISEGLSPDEEMPADSPKNVPPEWSYHKQNSPTYIELHTSLFPPTSEAYGNLNELFEGALDRTMTVQIEDVKVRTLGETDHLLFLLCHAYKHFLHSGVGIRQICDIGMFIRAYDEKIDWKRVREACDSIRISKFAAAIFQINVRHLRFDVVEAFADIEVDEMDLLEDILAGGSLGTADIDRMHSSTITLEAVAAEKSGRKKNGAMHSVFLPARSLEGRFHYLKKHKWLLPVAWGQRAAGYIAKRVTHKVDPGKSLRIGSERTELLRKYGIIE